jgi:hypothetical protein
MAHLKPLLISTVASLVLYGTGCTNIMISQRDSTNSIVNVPNGGTYANWNGLPYYLPKAKVKIDGTWNKDSKEWDVKISPLIEPEIDHVFNLHSKANVLFDDDVSVSIDTNGLLQTVSATSEDKTVSALGDLIAAAANAMSFGAGLSPQKGLVILGHKTYPDKVIPSSSFHLVLDPTSKMQDASVWVSAPPGSGIGTTTQTNQYAYVTVSLQAPPQTITESKEPEVVDDIEGIVVRVQSAYTVSVTPHIYLGTDLPAVLKQQTDISSEILKGDSMEQKILLPDVRQSYILPIKRRYLVKDVTKVALVNGTVQTYGTTKPSIVAGIVGIPKTLLSALVPIPLQIRTTVLNNVKAINDTRTAQSEATKAE